MPQYPLYDCGIWSLSRFRVITCDIQTSNLFPYLVFTFVQSLQCHDSTGSFCLFCLTNWAYGRTDGRVRHLMQTLVMVAFSITFQYRVNVRYAMYVTERQVDKYQKNKTKHCYYWTVFQDTCRMGRCSFWSWFDVNRSTFDEDMSRIRFYIIVPSDLDLWPSDLKFALLVSLVPVYVFTKLKVSKTFLLRKNQTHRTDWRTDRRTTCNA